MGERIKPILVVQLFLESTKNKSTRYANWLTAAADALPPHFSQAAAVDVEKLEAWCEIPDMEEGDISKFTTPFRS